MVQRQVTKESGHGLMPGGQGQDDPVEPASLSAVLRRVSDTPLRRIFPGGDVMVAGEAAHTVEFGPCPFELEPFPPSWAEAGRLSLVSGC